MVQSAMDCFLETGRRRVIFAESSGETRRSRKFAKSDQSREIILASLDKHALFKCFGPDQKTALLDSFRREQHEADNVSSSHWVLGW